MTRVPEKFIIETEDVRTVIAVYDFATMGGAQGDIDLVDLDGNLIDMPINILLTNMFIEIIIPTASASVSLLEIQGPGAFFTIINGATDTTFAGAGSVVASNQIIAADPSTYSRNTASGAPYINISGDDLTAGQLLVYIEYVQSGVF